MRCINLQLTLTKRGNFTGQLSGGGGNVRHLYGVAAAARVNVVINDAAHYTE